MQFQGTLLTILIIFILCLTGFYLFFGQYNTKQIDAYHELLKRGVDEIHAYTSTQHRSGIEKEFLFYDEDQRRQLIIKSEETQLVFDVKSKKIELIEVMKNVSCWLQEKIETIDQETKQLILYLESTTATYNYQTQQFSADGVKISRYQLDGNILPVPLEKPTQILMGGDAKHVTFSLDDGQLNFQAHDFKALFH